MSRANLIANWDTLSSNEKKLQFQNWMGTSSAQSGYARITQLIFHTSGEDDDFFIGFGEYNNKPIMQVSVANELFVDDIPHDDAIDAGDAILNISMDFYKTFNSSKDYYKYYNKQIDKWLDKNQKELHKEMIKAYAEMYKYYKKKYEDFKS